MSYLLGNPAHRCYVYPDFDKALEKFNAVGIGPFFVFDEVGVVSHYRGEQHAFRCQVAFAYSGDSCIEINTPLDIAGISAFYNEFLDRNPNGGLHHIAYYSDDFDATLAMMERAGKPLRTVVDTRDPASGVQVEIFCDTRGGSELGRGRPDQGCRAAYEGGLGGQLRSLSTGGQRRFRRSFFCSSW